MIFSRSELRVKRGQKRKKQLDNVKVILAIGEKEHVENTRRRNSKKGKKTGKNDELET
jgi:hypothetical protein